MSTPKRPKRPRDPIQLAHEVFQEAVGEKPKAYEPTEEPPESPPKPEREKDPAAVALGRKGGLKGGKARVAKMTKEQLSDAARNAANARWKNRKP